MREVNFELGNVLDNAASVPVWFLRLIGPFGDFKLCSQADGVSYLGVTWDQANFSVQGPTVKAGAGLEANIQIEQHAGLIAAFLSDSWSGCSGSLHLSYYDGEAIVAPKLMLTGDIYGTSLSGKNLTLQLTAGGNRSSVTPWITIAPPLFNWLTPRGTLLVWGSEAIMIDR